MNFKFQISNFQFSKYSSIIFLIIISLMPLVALLQVGLPITHDGQDHVARIANFYQSLSEGNLIPRWAGNLNWGYGHPILMFLYPLPSYAASLFHLLGFSLVDSVMLVFAVAFLASGVTMYFWLREFLGETSAIVGSIIYNFAPYRFVDLYVRGAIGEHVAFIFPPLICYFLLKMGKESRFNRFYFVGVSMSLAGLILSHNALLLMFLPFIIVYGFYIIFNSKSKKLLSIIYSLTILLGFGLSFFFLYPAFVEGKYTLRDIVASSEYFSRFIRLDQLFYGPWSYGISGQFTVQVGILQWITVFGSLFIIPSLLKKERKLLGLYLIAFIYFVVSLFLMLKESDFIWQTVTILQKFQFPWRFLSVSVFMAAIIGGFFVYMIRNEIIQRVILVIVVIITFTLTRDFWQPKDYLMKPDSFYSGVYNGTTDTGESSPIWSVRFMEERPKTHSEVIKGESKIRELLRTSTHHRYEIESTYKSRIRENTLYFPGWRVYVDGKRYQDVQFQDPDNRGLITYYVPQGTHIVDIRFHDTRTRIISNYVSLASLAILIGILFKTYRISKR